MRLIITAICDSCNHKHDMTGVEGVDIEGYIMDEIIVKCGYCDEDKCEFCPKELHKDCFEDSA
jgi:hypothetical protein